MIYHGRYIDVLSLWGEYIDLPADIDDPLPTFLPKTTCPNPEHDTFKHHFQVNTKKPLVHCFAHCGISGTYEHALSIILGVDEREARRVVLRASRVPLPGEIVTPGSKGTRKRLDSDSQVERDRRAFTGHTYSFISKEARAWLERRGVEGRTIGRWQIGFDEDVERIVFPALDLKGTLRFLIRRRIDSGSNAKYLYTPGAIKTSILFGACFLWGKPLDFLVLTEGPLDAILLQQLGIPAVAILGSGLSTKQVRIIEELSPKRIYLMMDKDEAGANNILLAKERITKRPLFVCRYPKDADDPAELARSKEATEKSIERALTIHEFTRLSGTRRRRHLAKS